MDDGVDGADILQKLIAKSSSLTRALNQSSNIPNFYLSGRDFFWLGHSDQFFDLPVEDGNLSYVRINGAERVVASLSLLSFRKGIEECALPNIRIAHNPARSRAKAPLNGSQNQSLSSPLLTKKNGNVRMQHQLNLNKKFMDQNKL